MKERPVWCMIKKLNERKKVLDKIHPSSDVQNIMANKILSYIEVICHNKIAYYSTGTNYSYPYPLFIQHTIDSDMEEWGADEQTWRTMLLSYWIMIQDDVEINEFKLPSNVMYLVQQLIFENYSEYEWYKMNTPDI